MAEYIEKDLIYKKVAEMEELARNRYLDTPSNSPVYARYLAQLQERTSLKFFIADFPAADVVPVVRCKDCVHWRKAVTNDKGFLICPASGMEITESDFCSYGEREENMK